MVAGLGDLGGKEWIWFCDELGMVEMEELVLLIMGELEFIVVRIW